jgi:hypothetical protein
VSPPTSPSAAPGTRSPALARLAEVRALSAPEILYLIALWTLCLAPAVLTALKGHVALFLAGFLTIGVVWLIAAFRLAKPNSPWARRWYDTGKMRRSQERYPDVDPGQPDRSILALGIVFGVFAAAFVGGFVAARL